MYYNNHLFSTPLGVPFLGAPKKYVWGAVAVGAATLLSNLLGGAQQHTFTKEQQKLQSRLNREEMAYSNGLNRSNAEWQANTLYGREMAGMKNSGMNPAMANGTSLGMNNIGSPSTGGTGPSASMPSGNPVGDALNAYFNNKRLENETKVTDAQVKNLDAQTGAFEAQANKDNSQADVNRVQSTPEYKEKLYAGMDAKNALMAAQEAEAHSNVKLNAQKEAEIAKKIDLMTSEITKNEAQAENLAKSSWKLTYDVMEILQGIEESEQRIILMQSEAGLNKQMARESKARVGSGMYTAQARRDNAQAGLTKQQTKTEEIQTLLLDFEKQIQEQYGITDQAALRWMHDLFGSIGSILGGAPRPSFNYSRFSGFGN